MDKQVTSVLAGGAVGAIAAFAGDWARGKYPQLAAPVAPATVGLPIPETDATYSIFKDWSFVVSGLVGVLGVGAAVFAKELKLKDEYALAAASAGVVGLTKAGGRYLAHSQIVSGVTSGVAPWANFARMSSMHPAYRRSMNAQTMGSQSLGLYNIK